MATLLVIIALLVAAAIAVAVLKLLVGIVVALVLLAGAVYVYRRAVPKGRRTSITRVSSSRDHDALSS